MSKVPGRYAATSEQWADAIRREERERIIDQLKDQAEMEINAGYADDYRGRVRAEAFRDFARWLEFKRAEGKEV
jgi:hypothetical protein